jgi:DNA-binding transcriptional MerR regulator
MTSSATSTGGLTVAGLARKAGVSGDTVRYYERVGLLSAPARSPAGYRQYSREAIDRLRFIHGAQRLGLRLREIRELLAVRDTGTCPCEPAETMLRTRISEIDQRCTSPGQRRAEDVRVDHDSPLGRDQRPRAAWNVSASSSASSPIRSSATESSGSAPVSNSPSGCDRWNSSQSGAVSRFPEKAASLVMIPFFTSMSRSYPPSGAGPAAQRRMVGHRPRRRG